MSPQYEKKMQNTGKMHQSILDPTGPTILKMYIAIFSRELDGSYSIDNVVREGAR